MRTVDFFLKTNIFIFILSLTMGTNKTISLCSKYVFIESHNTIVTILSELSEVFTVTITTNKICSDNSLRDRRFYSNYAKLKINLFYEIIIQ